MSKTTSWGKEIVWGEYQKELILPNLLRLLAVKKGDVVLDLGCGAGLFAREFAKAGARIVGVDVSAELIALAKKNLSAGDFRAGSADNLGFLKNGSVDKITLILAIQNIDNVHKVFAECRRVLKPGGKMFIVMNHPAFRVPKASDWGWDSVNKVQYRRIDSYMSEAKEKIVMHPSTGSGQVPSRPSEMAITFHRPLQFYLKLLGNNGFAVSRLEEWVSRKKSEPGQRAKAEDRARQEIPLFLTLAAF